MTMITTFFVIPSLEYYDEHSRFFSLIVRILSYFGPLVIILFYCSIFCAFLFLFYQYEKQRYTEFRISMLSEEVQSIAKANFDKKVVEIDGNGLGLLAESINEMINQAQKAIEEERRAKQIKNDLVTNVAHDLRSPLTSILGYLNLINNDQYRDEIELRYYTQIVQSKAERLHHLINDLFEYTFVQNKEILMVKAPINIEEMINQIAVQYRIQLQEAGMQVRQSTATENPITMGDGTKLVRVFENLIQNAIRYGKDGKYLDITIVEHEETIEVAISNYGQAIPSVDLPHIFDRFYRLEKSRSEYTGGSGLGLAIAKSIVELHNGAITVESTAMKTTFIVTLLKE
ncbi:HAMP domain-containing sensor histidine kinase [Neobacillus sp. DY30]|uniref:HAMP domain-containing sensor histidine kinase n=1 Tax=Neobacillus sp. DY30 TaxID=3047871 RepID=UPI0024C04D6D|nr:HAMP domain-containing sensor histidine kinase [Neobacillus sp. DY30]WHY03540.1 HAMP domain-containing sensor histidine kinase [Neobacillus sp. DY30]